MSGERWMLLVLVLASVASAGCTSELRELGLLGPERSGVFRIHVEQAGDTSSGGAGLAAVEQATAYWRSEGYDVAVVEHESEANRVVTFVRASGGHGLGRACVTDRTDITCAIEIGRGDESCNGVWTAFDQETLRRIAIHEVGHAMGLSHSEDPEDPMHATLDTSYRTFCELASGRLEIGSGDWWGLRFTVPDERSAAYEVTTSAGERLDTCIILAEDWERLAEEDVSGWACEEDERHAQGQALLEPGVYRFTVRCKDPSGSCSALYEVGWA